MEETDEFRIWIGGLPDDINEDDIRQEFDQFGEITEVAIHKKGKGPCFAFVNYAEYGAAADAVEKNNQAELFGMPFIKVSWPSGGKPRHEDTREPRDTRERQKSKPSDAKGAFRVSLENLPDDMSWQELKDWGSASAKDGRCTFSSTTKNGTGTLEFTSEQDMHRAIRKLDGHRPEGCRRAIKAWQEQAYNGDRRNDRNDRDRDQAHKQNSNEGSRRAEQADAGGGTVIWVGGLPDGISEDELRQEFDRYGEIASVSVRSKQGANPFAFIEYQREDDAKEAVTGSDQAELFGMPFVKVSWASKGPKNKSYGHEETTHHSKSSDGHHNRGGYRVSVENLPTDMDWKELKNLGADFAKDGSCTFARTNRDGTGVLEFTSADDMHRAIDELDGRRFSGSSTKLAAFQEKQPRSSRGRSRTPPPWHAEQEEDWSHHNRNNRNNHQAEEGGSRIWIGGLPEGIYEDEIIGEYKRFGRISEVQIHAQKGTKCAFAYVQFDELHAAEKAIERTNQAQMFGMPFIKVSWPRDGKGSAGGSSGGGRDRSRSRGGHHGGEKWAKKEASGNYRVVIENLPDDIRWQALKDVGAGFAKVGQCTFSRTTPDRTGILEFTAAEDMGRALDSLNGRRFPGTNTVVRAFLDSGDKHKSHRSGSPRHNNSGHSREETRHSQKGKHRAIIQNLPEDMSWQELKEMGGDFAKSGRCTFARTNRDGTGVLEYEAAEDLRKAITWLDGRRLSGSQKALRAYEE